MFNRAQPSSPDNNVNVRVIIKKQLDMARGFLSEAEEHDEENKYLSLSFFNYKLVRDNILILSTNSIKDQFILCECEFEILAYLQNNYLFSLDEFNDAIRSAKNVFSKACIMINEFNSPNLKDKLSALRGNFEALVNSLEKDTYQQSYAQAFQQRQSHEKNEKMNICKLIDETGSKSIADICKHADRQKYSFTGKEIAKILADIADRYQTLFSPLSIKILQSVLVEYARNLDPDGYSELHQSLSLNPNVSKMQRFFWHRQNTLIHNHQNSESNQMSDQNNFLLNIYREQIFLIQSISATEDNVDALVEMINDVSTLFNVHLFSRIVTHQLSPSPGTQLSQFNT